MQWYYVSGTNERLRFEDDDVPSLVRGGVLTAKSMVWKKGLEGWVAASEVHPEWFRGPSPGEIEVSAGGREVALVRELGRAFVSRRGWLSFVAVTGIVLGLAQIPLAPVAYFIFDNIELTITGLATLPLGAFSLATGVLLLRAVGAVGHAAEAGQRSRMIEAMRSVGAAAFCFSLGVLISLGFLVVWVVLAYTLWGEFAGPYSEGG